MCPRRDRPATCSACTRWDGERPWKKMAGGCIARQLEIEPYRFGDRRDLRIVREQPAEGIAGIDVDEDTQAHRLQLLQPRGRARRSGVSHPREVAQGTQEQGMQE